MLETTQATPLFQLLGAGGFGLLLGWYLYHLNRHRSGDVQLQDLVTVVGVIGGGAIHAIFPAGSDLFGAYGIGLALGFFGYLAVLALLVRRSQDFGAEWFLDGRRRRPEEPWYVPAGPQPRPVPMAADAGGPAGGAQVN
jgi:hypothetical protein